MVSIKKKRSQEESRKGKGQGYKVVKGWGNHRQSERRVTEVKGGQRNGERET